MRVGQEDIGLDFPDARDVGCAMPSEVRRLFSCRRWVLVLGIAAVFVTEQASRAGNEAVPVRVRVITDFATLNWPTSMV
jgi:hypothetical protein